MSPTLLLLVVTIILLFTPSSHSVNICSNVYNDLCIGYSGSLTVPEQLQLKSRYNLIIKNDTERITWSETNFTMRNGTYSMNVIAPKLALGVVKTYQKPLLYTNQTFRLNGTNKCATVMQCAAKGASFCDPLSRTPLSDPYTMKRGSYIAFSTCLNNSLNQQFVIDPPCNQGCDVYDSCNPSCQSVYCFPTSNCSTNFTFTPTTLTLSPSYMPTGMPTFKLPTLSPTRLPTSNPTPQPTFSPTLNTSSPTFLPTTNLPTKKPTSIPTFNPTSSPTSKPSTSSPTSSPTIHPTIKKVTTSSPSSSLTTAPSSTGGLSVPLQLAYGFGLGFGLALLLVLIIFGLYVYKVKKDKQKEEEAERRRQQPPLI